MDDYLQSIVRYRIAMSMAKSMLNKGIITEEEYAKIDTIMAKNAGLSLDMTETELNTRIAELEEEQIEPAPPSRTWEYRRGQRTKRFNKLYKIVTSSYVPHAGYVDWSFEGAHPVPSGKYIKYPKNSNCQRWIKRQTSKRVRHYKGMPVKGNHYRRLFDYWWTLY